MTREYAAELLPVIKAYSEGKDIEFRHHKDRGHWHMFSDIDQDGLDFNGECEYRIYKPSFTVRTVKSKK